MLSVYEIGERIAAARKIKNLSQAQLADKLAVSAQAVGKWERGESMPDIITFNQLAEVLDTDINYFVGKSPQVSPLESLAPQEAATAVNKTSEKPGWNMSGANWLDADFSGLNGLAEKFSGANIQRCKFVGSEIAGLTLRGNNIISCDFTRADLSGCRFGGSNIVDGNFGNCNLNKAEFNGSHIKGCNFSGAELTNIETKGCSLQSIKLTGANLRGTIFRSGQFSDTVFDGELSDCAFENTSFIKVEFNGATIRNTFFKNSKLKKVKFIGCKADRLSYQFMKANNAELSDVSIIENGSGQG